MLIYAGVLRRYKAVSQTYLDRLCAPKAQFCHTLHASFSMHMSQVMRSHWGSIAGTQAAETPDVKSTAPGPPAAPAAPEVKPEVAAAAGAPAAPEAAAAASAVAGQPADPAAADAVEAKPAADAADAALDQKMAKEDKPRLVQVRTFRITACSLPIT